MTTLLQSCNHGSATSCITTAVVKSEVRDDTFASRHKSISCVAELNYAIKGKKNKTSFFSPDRGMTVAYFKIDIIL